MEFKDYQEKATETAIYPRGSLVYLFLGLSSEAGELASVLKKVIRDGGELDRDNVKKELGDVLWYLANICNELEIDMADVAAANIAKLADRKRRGVLGGSGDNR